MANFAGYFQLTSSNNQPRITMKKLFILLECVAVFFLILSCEKKEATAVVEKNTFQGIINSIYLNNKDAVGIMMHIESPDKNISWSGAVGTQSKSDTTQLTASQPANLASNTKTYVAATILRLVEQNKISLEDPIVDLVTQQSKDALENDGYDLSKINVKHLLSHTSGIFDYVSTELFDTREKNEPSYQWTKDEQIQLAMDEGDPLGTPGAIFSYSDTNYLLLAEIIEKRTEKPFYTAIRELINYKKHGLNNTWFMTLEDKPSGSGKLINQYSNGFDSYVENVSFDLYGGGGIASNMIELAQFTQLLFEGKLFDTPETKNLMFTEVKLEGGKENGYRMGISKSQQANDAGSLGWSHGGFWGTFAVYLPESNTSIAISISNADQQRELIAPILKQVTEELARR